MEAMNIIAVIVGPIVAVIITLWYQSREEKRNDKYRLFTILMAHRKSNPPTFDLVQGLNLIDLVFADHREIVDLWHQYFELLCQDPVNWQIAGAKYLDLLAAMGKVLGYKDLKQTDISRFYSPVAHGNQAELNYNTQIELLRVLKNTAALVVTKKENDKTGHNS